MPDDDLKQNWLDSLFSNKDDIFAVFDDETKGSGYVEKQRIECISGC